MAVMSSRSTDDVDDDGDHIFMIESQQVLVGLS